MAENLNNQKMGVANPESLHQISKSTKSPTGPAFVNPGTPDAALVTREQLANATINGGTKQLKDNLIKG